MHKSSTSTLTRRTFLLVSMLAVVGALLIACGGAVAPTPRPASSSAAASTIAQSAVPSAMPTQSASSSSATAQPATTNSPTPTEEPTETPAPTLPPPPPGTVVLEIGTATGATDFKYDKATLEAPAGSKIRLKFTNNTNMKDEVGHNWVLVKPGQEKSVLANALAAGDAKDWLKEGDPGIIAHTALIEGEKSDTIMFDAPPPGTYLFISTFPKQYEGGMKGTLIIK